MNFTITTLARSLAEYLAPFLPGVQMLEDPAQQGVEPPCMFIQQRGSDIKPYPGGRWLRTIRLDLTYLLDYNLADLRQQYNKAAETLDFCMETFPYSVGRRRKNSCIPTSAALDIDDDGLHYKFELRVFVEKPVDAVKMQTQTVNQKVDQ